MNKLRIENVTKTFGNFRALKGISLSVGEGEFVSFLGGSGCGKTTTLRIIAGFERATTGSIFLDGLDLAGTPPEKRNLGFVFQHYALFPNMDVRSNIAFGLKGLGLDRRATGERVDEYLALVRMEDFANRYPKQLSGGQQQRVSLARALARRPDVLLLDEPLSALDAKIRAHLRTEIRAIQRKLGITALYVTHDQEEALSLSDRIMLMRDGEIEQIGTPDEIYNAPASEYAASFIGTTNRIEASVGNRANGTMSIGSVTFCLGSSVAAEIAEKATIVLRPENIAFQRRSAEDISIQGRIIDRRFLGSVYRMEVSLRGHEDGNAIFVDAFNNGADSIPRPGDEVTLHFKPEDCLVY